MTLHYFGPVQEYQSLSCSKLTNSVLQKVLGPVLKNVVVSSTLLLAILIGRFSQRDLGVGKK